MSQTSSPISQRIEANLDFDKRLFFLILVILFLLVRYVTNDLILQSIPGYDKLESEGSFMIFHIFNALNYIWTPFALLWKFTTTAFVIWLGAFAFGYKAPFVRLWQFVLVVEFIFIIPELIKMLVYIKPSDSVTYEEIRDYYPLSLFSMVNPESVAAKYHYPLRAINLFELIYVVFLIFGFHTVSRRTLTESTFVVLFSYVLMFLLWLLFYTLVYK
ncbi:sulfate ABC transporter permease [Cognataquiflexum rubidum]|uniref:sulfate ABC transporter permease n=1 Tax=Cognataquiflexum rubidum TaxID=2922273 RepID=UPI001F1357A8|nr:sulfate ABC transporter permease [Cognataquiflexum rubidum]MCH6235438.1 sulfate ABC transporter permease [Cognataquiflexum rubidum]